eukprot:791763-Amphidinium_carterae.3
MATLAPWRAVGHHPQLQASEGILSRMWFCARPVVPEDVDAPPSFTEIRVYAIHFPGAPGDPLDYILACVPSAAVVNPDCAWSRVSVECFGDGGPLDMVDTVDVALLLLPGSFLNDSLVQSAPASSSVIAFSDLVRGASPSPADLFANSEVPAEMYEGAVGYLELGENMVPGLRLASLSEEDNEWFASAAEDQPADPLAALEGQWSLPASWPSRWRKAKPRVLHPGKLLPVRSQVWALLRRLEGRTGSQAGPGTWPSCLPPWVPFSKRSPLAWRIWSSLRHVPRCQQQRRNCRIPWKSILGRRLHPC